MSSTIIAAFVSILSIVLPWFNVEFNSEELTNLIQGVVVIGSALWVWYQRTTLEKAPLGKGDVNFLGKRV